MITAFTSLKKDSRLYSNIELAEDVESFRFQYCGDYITQNFLYFAPAAGDLYFSSDFFELSKFMQKKEGNIKLNQNILSFFLKCGYTPFDQTIFSGIYKLPNYAFLRIQKSSRRFTYHLIYPEPVGNNRDTTVLKEAIETSICPDKKNVILFSGGFDSTLIAELCKNKSANNSVPFELVTGRFSDLDFLPNKMDEEFSLQLAKAMGLSLKMIDCYILEISKEDMDTIILKQPNAAHCSFIFNQIYKSYKDQNVQFISGQQADSVLGFGSTSLLKFSGLHLQGAGELFRRFYYLSSPKVGRFLFRLLNSDLNARFYQLSLMAGIRKLPLIKNKALFLSFEKVYKDYLDKSENPECILNSNLLFYIQTFLSGSDSSGILNVMHTADSALPFNRKVLLNHFLRKRFSVLDKIISKKPVHDLLHSAPGLLKLLKQKPNTPNLLTIDTILQRVSAKLQLQQEFEELCAKYSIRDLTINYHPYHLVKCYDHIH